MVDCGALLCDADFQFEVVKEAALAVAVAVAVARQAQAVGAIDAKARHGEIRLVEPGLVEQVDQLHQQVDLGQVASEGVEVEAEDAGDHLIDDFVRLVRAASSIGFDQSVSCCNQELAAATSQVEQGSADYRRAAVARHVHNVVNHFRRGVVLAGQLALAFQIAFVDHPDDVAVHLGKAVLVEAGEGFEQDVLIRLVPVEQVAAVKEVGVDAPRVKVDEVE